MKKLLLLMIIVPMILIYKNNLSSVLFLYDFKRIKRKVSKAYY